jgi:hypothetical protein
MEGEALARAREAAVGFIQGLVTGDAVAVLPFGRDVPPGGSYTSDFGQAVIGLRELAVDDEGGTVLYDAVADGAELAATAPTERGAILLLTDGQQTAGAGLTTREDAVQAASDAGIPIFSIALGEEADAALLSELAMTTSGAVYQAPTANELAAAFDAIGGALRGQYLLEIDPPQQVDEGQFLAVEVPELGLRAEAPMPAAEAAESSIPVLPVLAGAGAIAVIGLLVIAWSRWRRARRGRSPIPGGPGSLGPRNLTEAPTPSMPESATGTLRIVAGPDTGLTATVGPAPALIGSGADCDLRLSNGAAARQARVWLQHDRLVLHHLAFGHQTLVDDKPVEWTSLGDGTQFRIGPHLLLFNLN